MKMRKGDARMRLKDVVALVSDKTEDNTLPYIGLENIVSWNASFVKTESSIEGTNSVFKAGDVLFGKLRPYLAKAYIPMSDGIARQSARWRWRRREGSRS